MPWLLYGVGALLVYYYVSGSKTNTTKVLDTSQDCTKRVSDWLNNVKVVKGNDQYQYIIKLMKTDEGLEVIATTIEKAGDPALAMCVRELKGLGNNI